MVGRTLQRYRLVEQVGHGGMAVVYRGLDESLERDVAVKLLHPHLAARPEHRRRLAREAKAVARLQHPNILEIFDFSGEDSQEAFLVTELIRGPTLKAFALEHPFSPPELAAACVHELAGALGHAHAHGIVHRDLKPENVMIQEAAPQPTVKLMDFGIAQILDRDERMTVTGSLMGSPAHMAPEIIDGEEADERSDIFSLGTILYWLVTGSLPFEGANPGALLKKVLEGEFTDPRMIKPDVSDTLAKVIADALARDRAERIASAQELQTRLLACMREVGLDRPGELLAQFLRDPVRISQTTRSGIIEHLMRVGDEAAAGKKTGKALAAYGRVIAIAPGTPQAGAAREAIDRLNSRVRWRRRAVGAAAMGAMASLTFLVWRPVRAWMASRPVEASIVLAHPPQPAVAANASTRPPGVMIPQTPEVKVNPPATDPVIAPIRKLQATHEPLVTHVKEIHASVASVPRGDTPPVKTTTAAQPELVPYTVTVYPPAALSIDHQQPMGQLASRYEGTLKAGPHHLSLAQGCCDPSDTDVTLDPKQPRKPLEFFLRPRAARVTVVARWAEPNSIVRIQDKRTGEVNFSELLGKGGSVTKPYGFYDPEVDEKHQMYEREVVVRLYAGGLVQAQKTLTLKAGDSIEIALKQGSIE